MAKAPQKKQSKKSIVKKSARTVATKAKKKPVTKPAAKKSSVKKPAAKQSALKTNKPAPKKVAVKASAKKAVAKKLVVQVAKKSVAKQPVKAAVKAPAAPVATKPAAAANPIANRHAAAKLFPKAPVLVPTAKEQKALYKVGNYVVYPTHGVGKIMAEETQMIGDIELRLLVINFEKDKMTLRVPMNRAAAAGLRPISGVDKMKEVYVSLKSKAKISRGMWSRRAQEYEAKINSGNIILISEVVRDLHQNVDQSERSYSERMIYENALNRLVGEVAAAEGTDTKVAYDKLMKLLRAKVAAAASLKEAA